MSQGCQSASPSSSSSTLSSISPPVSTRPSSRAQPPHSYARGDPASSPSRTRTGSGEHTCRHGVHRAPPQPVPGHGVPPPVVGRVAGEAVFRVLSRSSRGVRPSSCSRTPSRAERRRPTAHPIDCIYRPDRKAPLHSESRTHAHSNQGREESAGGAGATTSVPLSL
jgi:hypothetical protein